MPRNEIDIPIPLALMPVQPKILPRKALDSVADNRLAHFSRYRDAKTRSLITGRKIFYDKAAILDCLPVARQMYELGPF